MNRPEWGGDDQRRYPPQVPDTPERAGRDPEPADLREEWGGAGPTDATQPSPPTPAGGGAGSGAHARPAGYTPTNRVRGVVRDIKLRPDLRTKEELLTFRVERYDDAGNRVPPVPVEVHRYRGGSVTEGDEVEVKGRWQRGNLRARRVRNLTTSAEVRGSGNWGRWGAAIAAMAIVAGVVYAVVALVPFGAVGAVAVSDASSVGSESAGQLSAVQAPPGPAAAGQQQQQQQQPPRRAASRSATTSSVTPQGLELPAVVGMTKGAAVAQLSAQGLKARVVEVPDSSVPAGTVTKTDPEAGAAGGQAAKAAGGVVTVYVSSGPSNAGSGSAGG